MELILTGFTSEGRVFRKVYFDRYNKRVIEVLISDKVVIRLGELIYEGAEHLRTLGLKLECERNDILDLFMRNKNESVKFAYYLHKEDMLVPFVGESELDRIAQQIIDKYVTEVTK
ncbi:hypothetical protein [Stygiolobus caldivivus]|uniref:Uncharacterized protein n=1 Tax=Stygiolobus caldivivus TaxID=2824673 RepID=A0A8D5U8J7_9CREN|nr:hypothetical protein [Stygiolobus caldivivus]BCU71015.1 hypothetical protein KN1_23120 [Stygiolobus caldivivus]